jgi:hypothetical protein
MSGSRHLLGIDKDVSRTRGWGHMFQRIADRAGISERISDAITGHASVNVSRSYGAPGVSDMAAALATFPRFEI